MKYDLNFEFDGQKYVIPEVYDRGTYDLGEAEKTEISHLGIYDPNFQKKYGFTTRQSVLKWWCNLPESDQSSADLLYTLRLELYFREIGALKLVEKDLEKLKPLLDSPRGKALKVQYEASMNSFCKFTLLEQPAGSAKPDLIRVYAEKLRGSVITLVNYPEESGSTWTTHHNYSYKMDETTHNWYRAVSKESRIWFGLELECSSSLSMVEIQKIVTDVEPKQEPFFIFKQDSTITETFDNNYELVTVPCSPRYLRTNFRHFFDKLDRLTKAKGMTIGDVFDVSSDTGNGLHIHVDKESFTIKRHIKRFLALFHSWEEGTAEIFEKVACRGEDTDYCKKIKSYQRKSSKYQSIPHLDRVSSQKHIARVLQKPRENSDKHVAATEYSSQTVEVRAYKGLFSFQHILRCISFTEAILEFTDFAPYSSLTSAFPTHFEKFIMSKPKYRGLRFLFSGVTS